MFINDAILLATGGLTVNDGLASWFSKAINESLNDAEYRWLIENGASSPSQLNDMWDQVLNASGYSGSLSDKKLAFWAAGGVLISPKILTLNGTNYAGLATPITFSIGVKFHLYDRFILNGFPGGNNYLRGGDGILDDFIRFNSGGDLVMRIGARFVNFGPIIGTGVETTIEAISDGVNLKYLIDGAVVATNATPVEAVVHTYVGASGLAGQPFTGIVLESRDFNLDSSSENISWKLDSGDINRELSEEFPATPAKDLIYYNVVPGDWS